MEGYKNRLVFFVNGKKVEDGTADPRMSLTTYLRTNLQLTGTKIGCNEGGCGACTVMISEVDRTQDGRIKHYSVNSCLMPLGRVHGRHITTVEGIGSVRRKLHPVQERLSKGHGSQCGFCTPGFVMAMYSLLRENPNPSVKDVEESLQGNLCRCTGYRPILEAYYSFCSMGEACCKNNPSGKCAAGSDEKAGLNDFGDLQGYDPSQEAIFPSELQMEKYDRESLAIKYKTVNWYRPTKLADLLQLKSRHPDAKIVQGNSEIGVEMKFRFFDYQNVIDPTGIEELKKIEVTDKGLTFGSCVTLSQMQRFLAEFIPTVAEEKTRMFRATHTMLHWFAGKHIRNTATWAGNLMTSSPISDLSPLFMAANGARILVESADGNKRHIEIDDKFFTGYRRNVVKGEEFVVQIELPFTSQDEYYFGYKQAQRREDDIAIANAGMYVRFEQGSKKVQAIRISFGGMAPTTIMATKTVERLRGRAWDEEFLNAGLRSLLDDIPLPPGVPGGMEKFRQTLCLSFFFKFYHNVKSQMDGATVEPDYLETDGPMKAIQIFQDVPEGIDGVGRPLMHLSGEKHTTGEAVYCDDIAVQGALHMAFVMSQKAHAVIKSVDYKPALAVDGVVDVITYRDVPEDGSNVFTHQNDQFVFAVDEVLHYGQVIAGVVATDAETARRAAQLVKVEYEDRPLVVTIEEAIEKDSYLGGPWRIQQGDAASARSDCERMIEGEVHVGGQEHFYLETHGCIAIPGEDDEMEIISSTQGASEIQMMAARVLGVPYNKVVCKVKRIGGGFGGKEMAGGLVAMPAVVAANKLRKPVRVMMERFDDMTLTGTRHPFMGQYKLGMDKDYKFRAFELKLFSNCGYSYDMSVGVMHRALLHADNVYRFNNLAFNGRLCKTNWMSATAFRGFGGPQGMFITEACITDVAYTFGVAPEKIREMNLYEEGDEVPCGQKLEKCNARRCWSECIEMSDFHNRRKEVDEWNKTHRWLKRGITVVPTKYGCAFGIKHLNQAGALVHVYQDGSVLISHGGMEMGQGLHTKMVQIASRALGIPVTRININNSATDKVPNASPTAGSMGSDLNGMAVLNACEILRERLEPVIAANPKGTWDEWAQQAYLDRINLSATGFYKMEYQGVDFNTGKGEPYGYFVYGAACTEVEIDCLTGDHRIKRTDIVMDIGDSLNPAVDIGQIEGAFIQGYGLFTMEELKVSAKGVVITRGPGTYKIPSVDDCPRIFNVKLLKGSSNPKAIFSSKAVGEPPLFLGSTAYFAIKDAIKSAREDYGLKGAFRLDSPASPERIRLACRDHLSDMVAEPKPGTYIPWTVKL